MNKSVYKGKGNIINYDTIEVINMNKSVYEGKDNIINYDTIEILSIMKIITVKCYKLTLIEKTDNLLKFK